MKKYFYLAAVSAMMLTACTSEKDTLEAVAPAQQVTQQAVGFDVYVPAATAGTRAGLEGTMTTSHMQLSENLGGGFGVYAYLTADADDAVGDDHAGTYNSASPGTPNFMVNEKLLWNAENQGWYYNPLKYWPNETDQDSQNTPAQMEGQPTSTKYHLDRLSFFAYAPYVAQGDGSNPGINRLTNKVGVLTTDPTSTTTGTVREATIGYQAAIDDPNASVDLLWGVAPAGGLTYTAVNGRTVTVAEGMPLINMTKPDINTTMKFLFNHALARIGIKAVAAVDQVGAGGTLDPNTKITINKITLTGYFGTTGELNLDNTVKNKANWTTINGIALSANPATGGLTKTTLTLDNADIAEHLRFVSTGTGTAPYAQTDRVGVTTVKQDVIDPSKPGASTKLWASYKEYGNAETFPYSETTPYYLNDATCTIKATAKITAPTAPNSLYTVDANGVYTQVAVPASVTYPEVNKWFVGEMHCVQAGDGTTYDSYQAYTKSGTAGTASDNDTFTPKAVGTVPATGDWVIKTAMTASTINYVSPAANTKYYTRDANYFMVIPNKNFENSTAISASADEIKALRTVRVMIEYYITTEDGKLNAGRAQTKNVIEKDVVFPGIENGKSYNLNLILGLTSVKMEAEVDDWKVVNVQGDLPQNTGN